VFFEKVYHAHQCTGTCGRINIAVYKLSAQPGNTTHYDFVDLLVAVPPEMPAQEVSPEIASLSPSFASIYPKNIS
jgi:hypothetical protein